MRSYSSEGLPWRLSVSYSSFSAWKLRWNKRPINLLSSLLDIPSWSFLAPPSQLSTSPTPGTTPFWARSSSCAV